jgi:hypothetical protein
MSDCGIKMSFALIRGVEEDLAWNTKIGEILIPTVEDLIGIREELTFILEECELPRPEPLWQLSEWCITMQSIIDIEFKIMTLHSARGSKLYVEMSNF